MPEGGDGPSSAMSAPESTSDRRDAGAAVDQAPQKTEEQAAYSISPGSGFLGGQQIARRLLLSIRKFDPLGQNVDGGLLVHERFFRKAMGICVADKNTILLATLVPGHQVQERASAGQQINNEYDACYVPREIFDRGAGYPRIGLLEDGRIIFVNTLYNCLATPSRATASRRVEAALHFEDHQGGPLPSKRPCHGAGGPATSPP